MVTSRQCVEEATLSSRDTGVRRQEREPLVLLLGHLVGGGCL